MATGPQQSSLGWGKHTGYPVALPSLKLYPPGDCTLTVCQVIARLVSPKIQSQGWDGWA